jgi:hypothetical protein
MIKIPDTTRALMADGNQGHVFTGGAADGMVKRAIATTVKLREHAWSTVEDGTARFDVPILRGGDVLCSIEVKSGGRGGGEPLIPNVAVGFGIGEPCNIVPGPAPHLTEAINDKHTVPMCKLSRHYVFLSIFVRNVEDLLTNAPDASLLIDMVFCDFDQDVRDGITNGKFSIVYDEVSVLFRKNNDLEIRPLHDFEAIKPINTLFRKSKISTCDASQAADHLPVGAEDLLSKGYDCKYVQPADRKSPPLAILENFWWNIRVHVVEHAATRTFSSTIVENDGREWPSSCFEGIDNPFPRVVSADARIRVPDIAPGKIVSLSISGLLLGQNLMNRLGEGQYKVNADKDFFLVSNDGTRKCFPVAHAAKRRRTVEAMAQPDPLSLTRLVATQPSPPAVPSTLKDTLKYLVDVSLSGNNMVVDALSDTLPLQLPLHAREAETNRAFLQSFDRDGLVRLPDANTCDLDCVWITRLSIHPPSGMDGVSISKFEVFYHNADGHDTVLFRGENPDESDLIDLSNGNLSVDAPLPTTIGQLCVRITCARPSDCPLINLGASFRPDQQVKSEVQRLICGPSARHSHLVVIVDDEHLRICGVFSAGVCIGSYQIDCSHPILETRICIENMNPQPPITFRSFPTTGSKSVRFDMNDAPNVFDPKKVLQACRMDVDLIVKVSPKTVKAASDGKFVATSFAPHRFNNLIWKRDLAFFEFAE